MADRTADFNKLTEHSQAHMKALAALVNIGAVEFKGSSREWIDRDQAMRLVPALRDHAFALAEMLRAELLRAAGVASDGSGPLREGWQISIGPGHSGYGVYAHITEYPDEGAVCLATIDPADGVAIPQTPKENDCA